MRPMSGEWSPLSNDLERASYSPSAIAATYPRALVISRTCDSHGAKFPPRYISMMCALNSCKPPRSLSRGAITVNPLKRERRETYPPGRAARPGT